MVGYCANLGTLFKNLSMLIEDWGGYFITALGGFLLLIAAIKIVKAFATQGRAQTSVISIIAMIIIGGSFLVGGFSTLKGFSNISAQTLSDLASDTYEPVSSQQTGHVGE